MTRHPTEPLPSPADILWNGILRGLARGLGGAITIGLIVSALWIVTLFMPSPERDSTDMGETRSGITVRTDGLTGLQYLETTRGGLTPRLRSDGRQMTLDDEIRLEDEKDE
ncbi:hypothetical protein LAZ40_04790 [Cereibacter sphaeroides]|uniref:hypothetical protein n=1 Tax=Cereibacter sphaeroides TaxID=1063 RepID=UPI001F2E731C|nr:hypothetical protein [Cereibacter sphaeroides]MCE6958373.1 hypothetical protein [Cereibacter sphaeroides]MCE6972240.1 hypothetical protein [Cereibacter sphaeroides]